MNINDQHQIRGVSTQQTHTMRFAVREDCVAPAAWAAAPRSTAVSNRRNIYGDAPFASISSAIESLQEHLPWAQKKQTGSSSVVEPKTGTAFETEYCQRGNTQCGQLAGVGVRAKRIAGIKNINIYAVALYADPSGVRKVLHKFKGQAPQALGSNQAVFDELMRSDTSKTLAMSISFGRISSGQFWSAFQERLTPLMQGEGDAATIDAFGKTFDGIHFKKGLPLCFCIHKDTLTSKVDGKVVGTVKSRALCESLQAIYMGPDPASPDAKQSFADGLSLMLAA